jgi:nucleobase:cation symporter-1, NCS1 family
MAVSVVQDAQLSRRVESRHIDHIPAGARHGQPWHQFAFWFGGNVNVFNVVIGAVTVSIGLTFWPALIAIAVGTLIGALLIALHATQGPRLGHLLAGRLVCRGHRLPTPGRPGARHGPP